MSEETIIWGFEQPEYIRSKEHREFLIGVYNKNRPSNQQVHSMEELHRALLVNDIKAPNKDIK